MKEKEIWIYRMKMVQERFSGVFGRSVKKVVSRFAPHQSKRECARRLRQFPSLDLSRYGH